MSAVEEHEDTLGAELADQGLGLANQEAPAPIVHEAVEAAEAVSAPTETGEEITGSADQGEDWETDPNPTGLSHPDTAEITKSLVKELPAEQDAQPAWEGAASPKGPGSVAAAPAKDKDTDATFTPTLPASKIRDAAKSTGYGKRLINKKTIPESAIPKPAFKPLVDVGKKAAILRTKSPGSGYGKRVVTVKSHNADKFAPTFQPKLPTGVAYESHRKNAKSRIMDSQKKVAELGKKVKQETQEKIKVQKESGSARHTLAAVKCDVMEESDKDHTALTFTATPLNELEPAPVKHTKSSAKMNEKIKSHYSTDIYKPPAAPKAERPKSPQKDAWTSNISKAPVDNEELPPVRKNTKTEQVKSHYAAGAYTPKKEKMPERPKTPKDDGDWQVIVKGPHVRTGFVTGQDASKLETPPPSKSKKFRDVESSGYGVVSPVVNIAAKVESFKARDSRSMMKSTDYKDSQQKVQKKAADAGDENRNPRLQNESVDLINDLLDRAATLDPSATYEKPRPDAVADVVVEDVAVAEDVVHGVDEDEVVIESQADGTELTML